MCDEDIHEGLCEDDGLLNCPFCNEIIGDIQPIRKYEKCCENMKVIKTIDDEVCIKCGQMFPYDYVKPFIDFYENRHLYHKKSYYIRKYHIENTINRIIRNYKINMDGEVRQKIFRIFNLINDITPKLNNGRKRMVDIKFMIRKILKLMEVKSYYKIPISKSKKTLKTCDLYWLNIVKLIGYKMSVIIHSQQPAAITL